MLKNSVHSVVYQDVSVSHRTISALGIHNVQTHTTCRVNTFPCPLLQNIASAVVRFTTTRKARARVRVRVGVG